MFDPALSEPISINVAGEAVVVDLGICPYKSGLLAQLQSLSKDNGNILRRFIKFPGGAPLFRSILAFFVAAPVDTHNQESVEAAFSTLSSPPLSTNSLAEYLEAAALLHSPLLLLGLARSKVCKELKSGLASLLFEQAIGFTRDFDTLLPGDNLSEPMETAFAELVRSLCVQLDDCDFRLGPKLISTIPRVSLQVLKCYRSKIRSTIGASLANDQHARTTDWTEDHFASHFLKEYLQTSLAAAQATDTTRTPPQLPPVSLLGVARDHEVFGSCDLTSECDITEEICDTIPDAVLATVVEFAAHLGTAHPMLVAVMMRALLSAHLQDDARDIFKETFVQNRKIQDMVVTGQIPATFLKEVSKDCSAAVVVRQMLAAYETTDPLEICELCENVLFAELLEEEHASQVIFRHALMQPLLLWMFSGGAAGGGRSGAQEFNPSQNFGDSESSISRLRDVGARLFALCFLEHDGFLPAEGFPESPWDTGAFDMSLLEHLPPGEDALQLARRVLLRYLWRGGTHIDKGSATAQHISKLWVLGRWTRCHDEQLIADAFAFLSACWRALAGLSVQSDFTDEQTETELSDNMLPFSGVALVGSSNRRTAEEALFQMFADLDIWRLPQKDLLTPWVPGQVLVCHVTAQCRQLEESQVTLAEEAHANLQEIAELRATIAQLTARLEATDARSQACMQKQADLNETLRQLQ